MPATASLLKFQIGPVQDFIAQARSTRDLWSGSYLLSWLVAAGIKVLPADAKLIFPSSLGPKGEQPLLKASLNPDDPGILIPNLPNLFVVTVPTDSAKAIAKDVEKTIRSEWQAIADSVWKNAKDLGIPLNKQNKQAIFGRTVARHLAISWQLTPINDSGYTQAYRHNGWHLDAVRQTREFIANGPGIWRSGAEKDSLTGKDEALCGGKADDGQDYSTTVAQRFRHLFKHNDHLGAISLVKRVWHLTYLSDTVTPVKPKLKTESGDFTIRSIPAIAARKDEPDDNRSADEFGDGDKYIAAIAFDGDSIGKWVNGDYLEDQSKLQRHHEDFSKALSTFALGKVLEIVEGTEEDQKRGIWKGQLVYVGGDDVVCLVPSDSAIETAEALRKEFRAATAAIKDKDGATPDASAGIAIAHIHAPLQDLISAAQEAEKHAKNEIGRPAFSVTLMKRSGEISHWGSKWEPDQVCEGMPKTGGCGLYRKIAELMKTRKLSAKFPHRVCEFLTPYLTHRTDISKQTDFIVDVDTVIDLITREFTHCATRQGSKEASEALKNPLSDYLAGLLKSRHEKDTQRQKDGKKPIKQSLTQELLTSLIGLCSSVAFAHRTLSEPSEKQPA